MKHLQIYQKIRKGTSTPDCSFTWAPLLFSRLVFSNIPNGWSLSWHFKDFIPKNYKMTFHSLKLFHYYFLHCLKASKMNNWEVNETWWAWEFSSRLLSATGSFRFSPSASLSDFLYKINNSKPGLITKYGKHKNIRSNLRLTEME